MRCQKCGIDLAGTESICQTCSAANTEQQVRVLDPGERDSFNGLTIRQGESSSSDAGRSDDDVFRDDGPRHRVYVRQVSFGSSPLGLVGKLFFLLFFLFVVFVALPVALVTVAIAVIWWLIRRR